MWNYQFLISRYRRSCAYRFWVLWFHAHFGEFLSCFYPNTVVNKKSRYWGRLPLSPIHKSQCLSMSLSHKSSALEWWRTSSSAYTPASKTQERIHECCKEPNHSSSTQLSEDPLSRNAALLPQRSRSLSRITHHPWSLDTEPPSTECKLEWKVQLRAQMKHG